MSGHSENGGFEVFLVARQIYERDQLKSKEKYSSEKNNRPNYFRAVPVNLDPIEFVVVRIGFVDDLSMHAEAQDVVPHRGCSTGLEFVFVPATNEIFV